MAPFGQVLKELDKAHSSEIDGYRRECEKLKGELREARKAKTRAEDRLQKLQKTSSTMDEEDYASERTQPKSEDFQSPTSGRSDKRPKLSTSFTKSSTSTSFVATPNRLNILSTSSSGRRDESCVARIIKWDGFDIAIGFVIILNSIFIGFETQHRVATGTNPSWLLVPELVFITIYVVELFLRYFAIGFCGAMRSYWVQFDFFLVAMGILELLVQLFPVFSVGILAKVMVLRLLRILKLARMLRLMTQFKTLWLLVSGMINSYMVIVWTLVLLGIMVYMFSIFALEVIQPDQGKTEEYNRVAEESFGTLFKTVLTLSQCVTLDSVSEIYRPLILEQPLLSLYFLAFVILVSIALINLVTAMMVECALDQANLDKEDRRAWEVAEKTRKLDELRGLFHVLDLNSNGSLTMAEIEAAMDAEDIQLRFQDICGTGDTKALFKCLDIDASGELDIDEFCDGIDKSLQGKLELHLLMLKTHKLMHLLERVTKVMMNEDLQPTLLHSPRTPRTQSPNWNALQWHESYREWHESYRAIHELSTNLSASFSSEVAEELLDF